MASQPETRTVVSDSIVGLSLDRSFASSEYTLRCRSEPCVNRPWRTRPPSESRRPPM